MGFDKNGIRFILESIRAGTSLNACATLGRQAMGISTMELEELLSRFQVDTQDPLFADVFRSLSGRRFSYAEPLLRSLGSQKIVSIDNSDYEKATLIHDLNQPIPDHLLNSFDCVIDGGTLEHVFDFPLAVANCMRMLKVGGHFLGINPANNCLNHGFYQFSPDLFWGIFSGQNGFMIEKMYVVELGKKVLWFSVTDPATLAAKEEFCNSKPVYLFVRAKKIAEMSGPVGAQQGKFYSAWANGSPAGNKAGLTGSLQALSKKMKLLIPMPLKALFHGLRKKLRSTFPPPFFFPEE